MFEKLFTKGSFISNIFLVSSTQLITICIALLTTPIISRLYSPEVYGVFAIFTSVSTLLSFIISLSFDNAIIYVKSRYKKDLFNGAILVIIIIGAIITMCLILFRTSLFKYFDVQSILHFWYFVPIFILIDRFRSLLGGWLINSNRFAPISLSNLAGNVISRAFVIVAGFAGGGQVLYMIMSPLISVIVACSIRLSPIRVDVLSSLKSFEFSKSFRALAFYKRYPGYVFPSELLHLITDSMPLLILALHFSKGDIGNLSYSYSLLALPISIMGRAIGEAFSQKGLETYRSSGEEFSKLFKRTYGLVFKISLPIFLLIAIFGVDMFRIAFGDRWHSSGRYAQIYSAFYFFNILIVPFFSVFKIIRKEKILLYYNFIGSALSLLMIITLAAHNFSLIQILIAHVIINSILAIYISYYLFRELSLNSKQLLCRIAAVCFTFILIGIIQFT